MPKLSKESRSAVRIQFFELIFGDAEAKLCLAITSPHAPKATFRQTFWDWPAQAIELENYILKHEAEFNIYFCINLLSRNERKKEACIPHNLLWADLDETDPMSLKIPPPIVIQSSIGRYQAIWRLTSDLPAYQTEEYSRRIAYAVGADRSGWDLTQLLRVPFTTNFKYDKHPEVQLVSALWQTAPPYLFETLEAPEKTHTDEVPDTLPDVEDIMRKYATFLRKRTDFVGTYSQELTDQDDWSSILWKLIHILYDVGMDAEEVFVVAREAPCNKYARDQRPVEHLWRDVLKARESRESLTVLGELKLLTMPELFLEKPVSRTFIDQYRDWAEEATDAVPQFHDMSCAIMLSAIIANSVRLDTSYGSVVPNLWGLILGDSTLTRKTTAMRMAIDLLNTIDPSIIMATDGSPEGLLTGLEQRPNKTSVFYKDEVSGFFDSINRKDYLAGMPETLTALYDVPPVFTRLLRKSTIRIESPAFIFFGGGIPGRVYEAISEEYVFSGFLPRFLVVSGDTDVGRVRPTGPPENIGVAKRAALVADVSDMYENYAVDVMTKIGGQPVLMPLRVRAELTQKAWDAYGYVEKVMLEQAYLSSVPDLATPTFDRLSRSILKLGIILGAARQKPKPGKPIMISDIDIKNAAWYVQDWGRYSIELILNAGKRQSEKLLDKIIAAINKHPGIYRSELTRHYHLNKREADEIFATLEDRMLVRVIRRGKAQTFFPF